MKCEHLWIKIPVIVQTGTAELKGSHNCELSICLLCGKRKAIIGKATNWKCPICKRKLIERGYLKLSNFSGFLNLQECPIKKHNHYNEV